jgi:hypothetical protein
MDPLRTLGLVIGLVVMVADFYYHRGPRWNRSAFILLLLVALGLIGVSVNPDSVNWLRDLLRLGDFEYGRLFALTICASLGAAMLALYAKYRIDRLQVLLDRIVCESAAERALSESARERAKPIMILIPALNEAQNLETLLPRLPQSIRGAEVGVLVVDDGSSDSTSDVAKRHGAIVARNVTNRGQGAASRVGYLVLKRCATQIVVTMDADNQHDPEEIITLVNPILAGEADLVIGSRVLGTADAPSRVRSLGILVFSTIVSHLSGLRISDCSSGFKAFRTSKMELLDFREDQFQASEVILEAAKKGLIIAEVPIHITHRTHGESRKGPNYTYGFFFFKTMIKTWWR